MSEFVLIDAKLSVQSLYERSARLTQVLLCALHVILCWAYTSDV